MTFKLSNPTTSLARCPQCSAAKPTLHLQKVILGEYVGAEQCHGWAVFQCSSCSDICCFKGLYQQGDHYQSAEEYFSIRDQYASEVMPQMGDDFSDWPERAQRYITQAVEALAAPDGAVMLAGSAVDAMLKEKGLTEGSVYSRIEKAVETHLLTPAMGEWAHAVRLSANNPRHADLAEPHATAEEARATIEFAKALGQFLFVLPAKIARGKEAAEKAKSDAGADDLPF